MYFKSIILLMNLISVNARWGGMYYDLHIVGDDLLNRLPQVYSLFDLKNLSLRDSCLIVASICITHSICCCCAFCFLTVSCLVVTIWVMKCIFIIFSILLFFGILNFKVVVLSVWIWYTFIFSSVMVVLLICWLVQLVGDVQRFQSILAAFDIAFYLVTFHFILIVNTFRKETVYRLWLYAWSRPNNPWWMSTPKYPWNQQPYSWSPRADETQ